MLPLLNPVTPLFEDPLEVTVEVPVMTAHIPVPIEGVLAFKVVVEVQSVCGVPALETVGGISRVTVTVLVDAGQVPFEMVHTN